MATIEYATVSTDGQTLQAQTEALHSAGCARIFAEKISGAYTDRPQLAKAIAALGEGDTLIVTKLSEYERHLILTRTAEGRTRAQANGVRFGRKPVLTAYQRAEALRRRAAGETLTSIAQLFGVSQMTIARLGSE
jgi:DNA invertase Pin-like site-specific DNA recombinase